MRLAVIWIVLASLAATVHADPGGRSESAALYVGPAGTTDVIDPGKARRTHAKLVAAGGVVLGLASAGVCVYARSRYDDAIAHLTVSYIQKYVDQGNDAKQLARVAGTGLFLAGAAALGTAAYLYFTAPEKLIVRRVIVAPAVGGDQAGLALVGSF